MSDLNQASALYTAFKVSTSRGAINASVSKLKHLADSYVKLAYAMCLVLDAAEAAHKVQGSIAPEGMVKILRNVLPPEIDWRQELQPPPENQSEGIH